VDSAAANDRRILLSLKLFHAYQNELTSSRFPFLSLPNHPFEILSSKMFTSNKSFYNMALGNKNVYRAKE